MSRARSRPNPPKVWCDDLEVAHNYSSQRLNSTAMAIEKLRKQLAKVFLFIYRFYDPYLWLELIVLDLDLFLFLFHSGRTV